VDGPPGLEGVAAAADPTMFPEQLDTSMDGWLSTWQVKKVASGGNTDGSGGLNGPDCNTGFTPAVTSSFPPYADYFGSYPNYDNVTGTWTGIPRPTCAGGQHPGPDARYAEELVPGRVRGIERLSDAEPHHAHGPRGPVILQHPVLTLRHG